MKKRVWVAGPIYRVRLLVFPDFFPVLQEKLVEVGVLLVELPIEGGQLLRGTSLILQGLGREARRSKGQSPLSPSKKKKEEERRKH